MSLTIPYYLVVAARSDEFRDIAELAEDQRAGRIRLIGLGYNEQTPYYKLIGANAVHAPVIALGTSRVMQIQEEWFKSDFYNCGGSVPQNYDEYINFLENLDYTPEAVLLGIDSWVFTEGYASGFGEYNEFAPVERTERDKGLILKAIFQDWLDGKWRFSELDRYADNAGFNGRIKDAGFRADGSYYAGYIYRNREDGEDYGFHNSYASIENGEAVFAWADHIYPETAGKLEQLIRYCKDNDICLIAFSTPYPPGIYETMADSGHYEYLSEIGPCCEELFSRYGYEYYDYTDGAVLNLSDDYYLDGFHGGAVVYASMMLDMCERGSKLDRYLDACKTRDLIDNAYDELTLYDPDE